MKESHYKKYLEQKTWFHGTTLSAWKELCNKKVKVDYNIGTELDFGYGFYFGVSYSRQWAHGLEGYVLSVALDDQDEVIGYKFVKIGKMLEDIRHGKACEKAFSDNVGTYGRYDEGVKFIDPREE